MRFSFLILLQALLVTLGSGKPVNENGKETVRNCGYQTCLKTDFNSLNVHIVPHSHDDVGWLKTVDQYYWGAKTNIQRAGVQYIIDSVVSALQDDPQRRFVQVETAFLHKWWLEQSEERKNQFRDLVDRGQLEIVGGAWSMNDEAAVHYQSVIDQFSFGLKIINDTLGECGRPKIGWQIDPFGHSKEMASIFAQMGYDALFFSRLDWRDKDKRMQTKTAEMIWQGSENLGNKTNLFTSVLYNHYSAPSGFCFDILCSDTPIIDDKKSTEFNQEAKVRDFAEFISSQARSYKTNNIIITMGDDFNYQDARSYFKNLDKLIEGFKKFPQFYEGKPMNVFYSTPSCYAKSVNHEAASSDLSFPLKTDDFFPYATDYHTYWTGYYTSRPTSKRLERQGNNLLQITKQLSTIVEQEDHVPELISLQEAMGIMQHHDAITGTEKQHVADDYARIVSEAIEGCVRKISTILSTILPKSDGINLNLTTCMLANVSVCPQSQSDDFVVAIYNPLGRTISEYIRLPVDKNCYDVEGPDGEDVRNQVLPEISDFKYLEDMQPAPSVLTFNAENLPPLGIKLYRITHTNCQKNDEEDNRNERLTIGNEESNVEIDPDTGLISSITLNRQTVQVKQELMYYIGSRGNNSIFKNRASGAYIFRPSELFPEAVHFEGKVSFEIHTGDLVDEIHQVFSDWVTQIIRLYKNANYVEIDWLVGPINIDDQQGKEVISRFTTNLSSGDIFYTDSNGREMLERKRNFRPTFDISHEEPISGNYYPITSKISLNDNDLEFAVLNDRAQGGSSLESGQLELMLHRRLLDDDAFGVGEALNEEQYNQGLVARGQLYITLGKKSSTDGKNVAVVEKELSQKKLLSPWVFLTNNNVEALWSNLHHEISGLSESLPQNVHLLTLEPWRSSENMILLRLEHVFEKQEHANLSHDVTVNLNGLFTHFNVVSIEEMTLDGNKLLENNERLEWIIDENVQNINGETRSYVSVNVEERTGKIPQISEIVLSPMQIRTFLIKVSRG